MEIWVEESLHDSPIRDTTFLAHVYDSCDNENYADGILRDHDC